MKIKNAPAYSAGLPRFGKFAMLAQQVPDGGGSGGGGGGGAPSGGATTQFTQEQLNSLNGIVKAHLNRVDFGAMVAPAIKAAMDATMPEIIKSIGAEVAKATAAAAPPAKDDKKTPGGATISDEARNEMNALKAKLDQVEASAKAKDEALAKARRAEQDNQVNGTLKAALEAGRVRPELMEGALAVVRAKAGEVKWIDDGTGRMVPRVTVQRNAVGVGPYTEEVAPDAFAKEWFKTDEGKGYIAPPAGRGSGAGGSGAARPSGGAPASGGPAGQPAQPQGVSNLDLGNMLIAAYNGGGDD